MGTLLVVAAVSASLTDTVVPEGEGYDYDPNAAKTELNQVPEGQGYDRDQADATKSTQADATKSTHVPEMEVMELSEEDIHKMDLQTRCRNSPTTFPLNC